MLTRTLSIALLCLSVSIASAQERGKPSRVADRMERLTILLDLNEGQKAQMQQVLEEQHQQRKALREQARNAEQRPDREQRRAQHEKAEKELIDKLRPVLTDVQLKKFEVLRQGEPRHRRHRFRPE